MRLENLAPTSGKVPVMNLANSYRLYTVSTELGPLRGKNKLQVKDLSIFGIPISMYF
jgi:hypothetical protein